ncbi:YHYH protein [Ekhidna sp.]
MKNLSLIILLVLISSTIFITSCGSDDGGGSNATTFNASITATSATLAEDGGSSVLTVALDNPNDGDAIAFELNLGGTAVFDTDYEISSGVTEIANGASTSLLTFTAVDDDDEEDDETITVTVSFPDNTNVVVGSNGSLSLMIMDDDEDDGMVSNECENTTDSYAIDLDASNCTVDIETVLGVSSEYSMSVSGNDRTIVSNSIPDHNVGQFPNPGNPNTITETDKTFVVDANPSKNNSTTSLTTSNGAPRYWFGILDNGIVLAPIANEFFTNTSTGEDNNDWNENALSGNISLGTDCNNSHVFPNGIYHHHATPSAYIDDRAIDGSATAQVGWAADGFPIYYKYGNKDGSVVELSSSFRLKTTDRGGDGVSAPSGCPDGTYNEDYEYVAGLGDLDECNGYEDPTLGYIYVITDTYPSIPRCFYGTPSNDFTN